MKEPTDDELYELHYKAADEAEMKESGRHYDAYDGAWPSGLRAVWKAGFEAGQEHHG